MEQNQDCNDLTSLCNNLSFATKTLYDMGGCPHGLMVKAMDCGIVVREFVLQSR